MITANNVSLAFGKRVLFEKVNIEFTPGNCYGIIGANGAGKSTFLKILSGEIEADSGEILVGKKARISVLEQDQFKYDDCTVLETVFMGNLRLYEVMKEREELYAIPEMSEEQGMRVADLETEFAEMGGWESESEAATLLDGLGIPTELHEQKMGTLDGGEKVRVLLAQALFGSPDILILDEPTNHLDAQSMAWLEDFLINFPNTVILVSHDRFFLDRVCTHIADIDYSKIELFTGNYSYWYQATRIAQQQRQALKEKNDAKIKELKDFIARFGANAARSRQATARKKMIDKLEVDAIRPSSRRYPHIVFKADREAGKDLLEVEGLTKSLDGEIVFKDVSFELKKGQKVAFISKNPQAVTALFEILLEHDQPDSGSFKWGVTTSQAYFPKDNTEFFQDDVNLLQWMEPWVKEKDEQTVRSFLGRMLFSGEEPLKKCTVLSGGEKVRCMLARMMASGANVLLLDQPTNHLDLESIAALSDGVRTFEGTALFTTHDRRFIEECANRIIELTPNGCIDELIGYDDYMANDKIQERREQLYGT